MAFLQDIWDISIPGQRIAQARDLRAQREAMQAQRDREAAAYQAIQNGDVMGAAAQSPEVAGAYGNVQAGQDALRRKAGLGVVNAVEGAVAKGVPYEQAVGMVAQASGRLFGSPEERDAITAELIQGGPATLAAYKAALSGPEKAAPVAPSDQREFEYFQTLSPGDQDRYMRLKRASKVFTSGGITSEVDPLGNGRTVLQSAGETAAGERTVGEGKATGSNIGEAVIKDLDARYAKAQEAQGYKAQTKRAREVLKDGIISGSLPAQRLALSRAASTITGREMSPDAINTSEYIAIVNGLTGKAIQAFGAGTGLSDADREFARAMAAGDLAAGSKALDNILTIIDEQSDRDISNYEKRRKSVIDRAGDYGDLYPTFEPKKGDVISLDEFLSGGQ